MVDNIVFHRRIPVNVSSYGNFISTRETNMKDPYIKIIEQPASKALRFRYESEGRPGSIEGVNSTPENKTYPAVQIVGYKGNAVIVVSCVTKYQPYKPHPHNLVGANCKEGICKLLLNNDTIIARLSNVGVQCVLKKNIEYALRNRERIKVDPFTTGFSHRSKPNLIDLNAVRLCFQAFLTDHRGKVLGILKPVVSELISKKTMPDLCICRLSDSSASVVGGKEIILLCEEVAKDDIEVRFYEESGGQIVWDRCGDTSTQQIHKKVAIVFCTPRYKTIKVDRTVNVSIQLRRPSDGATSKPLPFYLTPDTDPDYMKRKRRMYSTDNELFSNIREIGSVISRQANNGDIEGLQIVTTEDVPAFSHNFNTAHAQNNNQDTHQLKAEETGSNITSMDNQQDNMGSSLNQINSDDLINIDADNLPENLSSCLILSDTNII